VPGLIQSLLAVFNCDVHAIRIVRGFLLKGNHLPDILPELWPIALFTLAVVMIAIWCYRETLD
jgi:ABC-2 type transport system permease protein